MKERKINIQEKYTRHCFLSKKLNLSFLEEGLNSADVSFWRKLTYFQTVSDIDKAPSLHTLLESV